MSRAYHCDKVGCGTWTNSSDFLKDWVFYSQGEQDYHFCSAWHCAQWISSWAEPSTEIEL